MTSFVTEPKKSMTVLFCNVPGERRWRSYAVRIGKRQAVLFVTYHP